MPANRTELTVGPRLRRVRQARGLSLQQVADRLARPVTRAALSKYERGEIVPRAGVLVDLGRVLGLPGTYFLQSPGDRGDSVTWLPCRKHGTPGGRQRQRILARAELAASAYERLLDLLHPGEETRFPPPQVVSTVRDAEEAADSLRARWGLGSGPVESLVACTEDAGAVVLDWTDHVRFEALSGRTGSGRPVFALNPGQPDDRRRFDLAHAVGHLVLETSSLAAREEERLVRRFAAALVVPREAAHRELGRRRARITRAELEHLKVKYRFPMQAWILRARDLGIITERAYRSWQAWFLSQDLHVRETADYGAQETPSRLRILAVQALAEGHVDRAWVQGFCPEAADQASDDTGDSPLRALLRKPAEERRRILAAAADAASEQCAEGPELAEFLGFDDATEDDDEPRRPPAPAAR